VGTTPQATVLSGAPSQWESHFKFISTAFKQHLTPETKKGGFKDL
jgi:hypothetical protein